jgi:hypothetical protein
MVLPDPGWVAAGVPHSCNHTIMTKGAAAVPCTGLVSCVSLSGVTQTQGTSSKTIK